MKKWIDVMRTHELTVSKVCILFAFPSCYCCELIRYFSTECIGGGARYGVDKYQEMFSMGADKFETVFARAAPKLICTQRYR